jgi:hypothetical protein
MSRTVAIYIVCSAGLLVGLALITAGLVFIGRRIATEGNVTITLPSKLGHVEKASTAVVILVLGTFFFGLAGWGLIELPSRADTVTFVQPVSSTTRIGAASAATSATSVRTSPPANPDPASIVQKFIDAINARDYGKAWDLGGKNLGRPYKAFAAGFADTRHDTLIILAVHGRTVAVRLIADHYDGQRAIFEGSYAVEQGEIIGARLHGVK